MHLTCLVAQQPGAGNSPSFFLCGSCMSWLRVVHQHNHFFEEPPNRNSECCTGPESGSSPAPTMAAAAPAVAAPEDDSTISGPGSTAPTQTHSRSVSDEEAVYRSGTLKED
eukprot:TRINITY_DN32591_c0_g1_i2.p3 TRINITY_DN32591_c0_g1~~TRINITY_DN32591_c0_g1_i2.p3  ORF type:complete len:111 (-),score=11.70 TRINITY_DN32591_c0_g1_i2:121-453(-)